MLSFLFLSFPSAFSSFPLPLSLHFPSLVSPLLPPFSFTPSLFYLSAPSLFFSCVFFILSSFFFFFLPPLFFLLSHNYSRAAPANNNSKKKKKQPLLQGAAARSSGRLLGPLPACPLAVRMGERLNLRPRRDGHLRSPPAPPPRPAGPPPAPPRLQRCRR